MLLILNIFKIFAPVIARLDRGIQKRDWNILSSQKRTSARIRSDRLMAIIGIEFAVNSLMN